MEFLKWPFIIVSILGAFGVLYSWNSDARGRSFIDFLSLEWIFDSENVSGGGSFGVFCCFMLILCVSLLLIYLELPVSMRQWLNNLV